MIPYGRIGALFIAQCAIALVSCGCGNSGAQETMNSAIKDVQMGLDTWKRGESATKLGTSSPPIEFFDDDWQRSARLVEFQITKTYLDTDGAARCAVGLVVQYGNKSPQQIQVTYQVVKKEGKTVIARDPFS